MRTINLTGENKQNSKSKLDDILLPLELYANGFTLNSGGKEEEDIINNRLDLLLVFNRNS